MPHGTFHRVAHSEKGILIIDGWEQLRPWTQWHVYRRSKRRNFGLLVSAHALPRYRVRPQLPILIQIEPDFAMIQEVVARLITHRDLVVPETVLSASFERCRGNVREMFFDLYLWYERNHR
ncbi:MAG: hypothetical protein JW829_15405 [Pirellulales bacterium]|nr:hypothetical protein [Pirellulales bacterium]